jgi:hypothetical protein
MKCVIHRDEDALFNCYLCKNAICVNCERKLRGRSVCATCLERIRERKAAQIEAETKHLNCPCAFVMGLVAAGAAAFAWSQFAVMSGSRLEVAAIGLGAIVAYGVMKGAGEKRGYNLQQISSVLALAGIISAHFLYHARTHGASLSAGSGPLGALYDFPGYLSELGVIGWLFLVAGTALAYHLPHPRALPRA